VYLEYDWTYGVWRPRVGDVFISVNGFHSYESREHAKAELNKAGLRVGRRTDTRTWKIERF
jgi:hypothetical protein